ncbi:antibiotic biosynthesis monooxygenase family protein [Qingshengfaniella alkalisoli]|uniref:Antibiotic biosynthesis monooxygenase n=1 Tax=Qingshengfaniella alkalisoli TaxID=2599296 RepID=A0A5B8I6V9_9RHOB|nr:antibiotic biosynthesis monooxygenase [Qingshengfaniella alkalisoli]QDY69345.1 antibiotic biosynthesis monooxygenase [Qingshengfaniella alkalisoli]
MSRFAPMPDPPYYAVIFANQRTDTDDTRYGAMADWMVELATARPGCIGLESTRDAEGFGITVSYWTNEAEIIAWKADVTHLAAQKTGREKWYEHYRLRVAKVERSYSGPEGRD